MANVGNLFVNISGSTKGLTKALTSAKTKLATFDKQVGRPGGDFMRRARGRFTSAMNERRQFSQQMSSFIGPQPAGHVEKIQARMGKKEAAARGQYRQAQRQQTISNMGASSRAMMTASFAAIGITISAVVSAFNIARKQAQSAENAVDAYKYAGPMGGKIAEEEVRKEMGALAAAQDPRISQKFLDKAKQERYEQETAIQSGSMGLNMNWNEISSEFGRSFAQAMGDLGVTGFLGGQGPSRNTGPVSTTGNTGGP